MKAISYISSIILWLGFIYTAITAVFYFINFFFSWSSEPFDRTIKATVLTTYILLLEIGAIIYKKLPHKPRSPTFSWLERLSLLN